ncbi:hypothetical protein N7495_006861 [Penicillium taxi]|uniref:uncharacterized protein n=1 Tax=Penicillium taxi TaxID=168475 RepID=UPI0025458C3D|nr:uncharacterized protein N7495_006861 [Penicillium taxi]KAJ5895170.1 hypothetical protein N7495_006861 [Penicillium taxi]
MANIMKKLKRRRRLSSELHDRWGDPSISYPINGSWNQWNQSSECATTLDDAQNLQSDGAHRYIPMSPEQSQQPDDSVLIDPNRHNFSPQFPKGYFDENIRHRPGKLQNLPGNDLAINLPRHDLHDDYETSTVEGSCDEENEERDTLRNPGKLNHRGEMLNYSPGEDYNPYPQPAKSPPLSVTSRMRRVSIQSATTDKSGSLVGASSRRTSYTAPSSVSAPSLPPDTPRYVFNSMHPSHAEKRSTRSRHREPEPQIHVQLREEMVPSYDDLFG